jgi:uncharacterized protein DUF4304
MRKLTDIGAIVRDTAARKQRAAQMRRRPLPDNLEHPRDVFRNSCAAIGKALEPEGFRYLKSGPALARKGPHFGHAIRFQSSAHNIRGEFVALWIHATVTSKTVGVWRKAMAGAANDFVAGGQIGNLEAHPGWTEWNLAAPEARAETIDQAVQAIRAIALPFLDLFSTPAAALHALGTWPHPGIEIVPAIELATSYAASELAQSLLNRFFAIRPELLGEYHERLETFRVNGPPPYMGGGYASELAVATLRCGLVPPSAAVAGSLDPRP